MDSSSNATADNAVSFAAADLDIYRLVGHEIKVFSEQFPGKAIRTRVVAAQPRLILVESGGTFDLIDNLVNQQKVVLQFEYKGQEISIQANLKRTDGGASKFVLEERAVPLSRRRFRRFNLRLLVSFAPFPMASHSGRHLSSLRWIAADSVNISSGGVMLCLPSFLERDVYLLMNIDWDDVFLPSLLLGQVRHCVSVDHGQFKVGIEFVVGEDSRKLFSPARMNTLPPSLFQYSRQRRERFNRKLTLLNPEETDTNIDRS